MLFLMILAMAMPGRAGQVDSKELCLRLETAFDSSVPHPPCGHLLPASGGKKGGMRAGVSAGVPMGSKFFASRGGLVDISAPINRRGLSFKSSWGNQSASYDLRKDPRTGKKMWTEMIAFLPAGLEQDLFRLSLGASGKPLLSTIPFIGAGLAVGSVEIAVENSQYDLKGTGDLGKNHTLASVYGSAGLRLLYKASLSASFLVRSVQNSVHHDHDATYLGGALSWTFTPRR